MDEEGEQDEPWKCMEPSSTAVGLVRSRINLTMAVASNVCICGDGEKSVQTNPENIWKTYNICMVVAARAKPIGADVKECDRCDSATGNLSLKFKLPNNQPCIRELII